MRNQDLARIEAILDRGDELDTDAHVADVRALIAEVRKLRAVTKELLWLELSAGAGPDPRDEILMRHGVEYVKAL